MYRYAVVTALVIALAQAAAAAQSTPHDSFAVTAAITGGCLIDNTPIDTATHTGVMGILNFGTHSAMSGTDASAGLLPTGAASLRCTPGITVTMRIGAGRNAGNGMRHMLSVTDDAQIAYELFSDSRHMNTLAINQPHYLDILDEKPITLPIYGHLTIPSHLPPGRYADTVTVSLEW